MANYLGLKWNKGGKLKRRKLGRINYREFEDLAEELDSLGANLQQVFSVALEESAKDVQSETLKAMSGSNLPAKGVYSTGNTASAINLDPKVKWSGTSGSIGFGFGHDKPNAGSYLITGTPRMQPDIALARIYASNKYRSQVSKNIKQVLQNILNEIAGGN